MTEDLGVIVPGAIGQSYTVAVSESSGITPYTSITKVLMNKAGARELARYTSHSTYVQLKITGGVASNKAYICFYGYIDPSNCEIDFDKYNVVIDGDIDDDGYQASSDSKTIVWAPVTMSGKTYYEFIASWTAQLSMIS